MTPEERISELEDEIVALHAAISELHTRLDASTAVVELLVHRSMVDRKSTLDLAKAIDRLIELRSTLSKREGNPGTGWLEQLRGDLLTWHGLEPTVRQAILEGKVRLRSVREQLKVVDGGRDSTTDRPPEPKPGDTN